jgi:PII-like signaling protein
MEILMNGYQVTFFTQQDRRNHGQPLADWLLLTAKNLGIKGGTVIAAAEGLGHDQRVHSAHFFELADQPMEVTFALSADEMTALFDVLGQEDIRLFYTKYPVEYGVVGKAPG